MPTGKQLLPAVLLSLTTGLPAVQAAPAAKSAKPAAPVVKAEPDDPLDVSAVKDKLSFVTDGKGHYVAYAPVSQMSDFLFYGDGKTFWNQRTFGGGSQGDIQFSRTFWEPRLSNGRGGSFEFRDKKFTVDCGERKTELQPVPATEAKTLVEGAKFNKPRWKWKAHFIARDERGNYYFVDRQRVPEDSKNYRLWVGPKGNLKQQKMTNVVSDTEGDIFATKTGSLRLVSGKSEWLWIAGKTTTKLTRVPVEDNLPLVYAELGVYAGEMFGTPCDDM